MKKPSELLTDEGISVLDDLVSLLQKHKAVLQPATEGIYVFIDDEPQYKIIGRSSGNEDIIIEAPEWQKMIIPVLEQKIVEPIN